MPTLVRSLVGSRRHEIAPSREAKMSRCMDMHGMSWMMGGMSLFGLLLLVLLVLGVAALVKYLRK